MEKSPYLQEKYKRTKQYCEDRLVQDRTFASLSVDFANKIEAVPGAIEKIASAHAYFCIPVHNWDERHNLKRTLNQLCNLDYNPKRYIIITLINTGAGLKWPHEKNIKTVRDRYPQHSIWSINHTWSEDEYAMLDMAYLRGTILDTINLLREKAKLTTADNGKYLRPDPQAIYVSFDSDLETPNGKLGINPYYIQLARTQLFNQKNMVIAGEAKNAFEDDVNQNWAILNAAASSGVGIPPEQTVKYYSENPTKPTENNSVFKIEDTRLTGGYEASSLSEIKFKFSSNQSSDRNFVGENVTLIDPIAKLRKEKYDGIVKTTKLNIFTSSRRMIAWHQKNLLASPNQCVWQDWDKMGDDSRELTQSTESEVSDASVFNNILRNILFQALGEFKSAVDGKYMEWPKINNADEIPVLVHNAVRFCVESAVEGFEMISLGSRIELIELKETETEVYNPSYPLNQYLGILYATYKDTLTGNSELESFANSYLRFVIHGVQELILSWKNTEYRGSTYQHFIEKDDFNDPEFCFIFTPLGIKHRILPYIEYRTDQFGHNTPILDREFEKKLKKQER